MAEAHIARLCVWEGLMQDEEVQSVWGILIG